MLPQRYVFSSKSQLVTNRYYTTFGCCCYHKGTYFQANHNNSISFFISISVVVATTKVRIFKQITTYLQSLPCHLKLLLLPQRYVFSSKSQPNSLKPLSNSGCCCYHKGTYFQANHNRNCELYAEMIVVVATTKVRIFKQITTWNNNYKKNTSLLLLPQRYVFSSKSQHTFASIIPYVSCCCYHKGTYFQANHNESQCLCFNFVLLLLPQRYVFSSKSQPVTDCEIYRHSCCCYHKGTYFQANHNKSNHFRVASWLLLLPQRYVFSSKSQRWPCILYSCQRCCCYHKGTYFQANHNTSLISPLISCVVVATTKVRIFKQITTILAKSSIYSELLLLPQRYVFSSKSQRVIATLDCFLVVVATTKVRIFKQITTTSYNKVRQQLLLLLPQRYVFSSKSQHTIREIWKFGVVVATTKVRIFKQITTWCCCKEWDY